MIDFANETFYSKIDRGGIGCIENLRFENCEFNNGGLSLTTSIDARTTVRNVELMNCRLNGCHCGPAIFEDVSVSGLETNDLVLLWGALFRRVTLRGSLGKFKLNLVVDTVDHSAKIQSPFDQFRERYYSEGVWALDIREAKFKEFEIRGIPSSLVLRNPESQVVVTRERALDEAWRYKVSPSNELWPFMIDMFLSDGEADRVFVVPMNAPKKKRDTLMKQLDELREAGVTIPD
jgi:hypothetical protein